MAPRGEKGFTLLEITVTIAITALLLMSIYGIFSAVSSSSKRLETEGEGFHQARVLANRLGREIRSAYYSAKNDRTRFDGGKERGEIPFIELSTTAGTPQSPSRAGISLVRYELRDDIENDNETKVLIRREKPLFETTSLIENDARISTRIEEMELRFYSGGSWQDQWRSDDRKGLPEMVELTLTIRTDDREVPFRTAFEMTPVSAQ